MQNWRNERDESNERRQQEREQEERTERDRREGERGLHFQDDYNLDRTRRGSGYGGGGDGRDGRPNREWAPGARAEQQPTAQERYRPSWSWAPPRPRERHEAHEPYRAPAPSGPRDPYESSSYGGQYEGRSPPPEDRQSYEPLPPPAPHQHQHQPGMFQRFKELVGKGPRGYRRSDERILEEVHERLSHGYLDASDIEVRVKDGEVTLEGTVRSKHDRRLAEDLVEDTLGVRELDNRLKVKKPDAAPPRL